MNIVSCHFTAQSHLDWSGVNLSGTVNDGVTSKDIQSIIRNMTRGKCAGQYDLSIEQLLHADPHTSRVISVLYSLCVSHPLLPLDLINAVVVPNKYGTL